MRDYTRVLIEFSKIRKGRLVHLHDHQPTELEQHMQQALRSIIQIRRMGRVLNTVGTRIDRRSHDTLP
jgi:hypothetical protein